ncbi:unnamed protein product [Rotaria sp. Silwood1]|nr:unnamed protein product [Rotaria sp. Silwood1]CAF3429926.1 unnamed protein product [Rotaria sp. Silwood1]CAF3434283.1 unnamed protein product [Rotaria sp. Silwood1]CAF3438991.1 unnamed protein product [Rotaria sp. Silwood1]CAF4549797.1 unnamed protein product [Rotaria sp. Silwood1]
MDRFHDEQTPFVFIDGIEKLSYKIAYINLTESSKKALFMAKAEILGIMRLRKVYGSQQPLKGIHLVACLHLTAQTGIMIKKFLLL